MSRKIFYNIVHLAVESIGAKHIPILLAYLAHSLKGVADNIGVLGLIEVAYKFLKQNDLWLI